MFPIAAARGGTARAGMEEGMAARLDELDRKILRALQQDAGRSLDDLAA